MTTTKCGFNDFPNGASGATQLVLYGPTLKVDVGFDPIWKPHPQLKPQPKLNAIDALVDTGASESCIDNFLAAQLNLPIIDRRHIAGVSGKQMVNMYLAQVHVPSLSFTIHGSLAGVDLKAGGQAHSVLIGRTFLGHFTMVYEGKSGTVTISN